jgi:LysR family glycine cleavage system transcriptional activator
MSHLPPLNALRAFEVCSRTRSFTLAAGELCISQGAVSRHIAVLENYLEVKLFERSHRQVTLTSQGERYAAELQGIFTRMRTATDEVRAKPARLAVKISLFPTVATRWLMPRIGRFHEAHPDIDLIIHTSIASPDPNRCNIDLFNVRGPVADTSIDYHPLFDIVLRPVCSPRLMNDDPPLRTPSDLARHMLLHSTNRVDDWQIWCEHAGVGPIDLRRGLEFDNTALACQAAINGAGVAMGIGSILDDELASGRLVEPFPACVATGETYGLAWRKKTADDPAIAAFRRWLRAEAPLKDQRLSKAS